MTAPSLAQLNLTGRADELLARLDHVTPHDGDGLSAVARERGWVEAVRHFAARGLLTPVGTSDRASDRASENRSGSGAGFRLPASVMTRKRYPTDLTDARWGRLEPLTPKPKSGTRKGGRPATDRREVPNAVFYHLRGGSSREPLPRDFPHYKAVFHCSTRWRGSGLWERVHDRLREDVRIEAGCPPHPATGRIDRQAVETTRTRGRRGPGWS
ncbi:MAG: transposase [Gemmataceae bacterium]|nr:transposase [Gemmataceae bacterium]